MTRVFVDDDHIRDDTVTLDGADRHHLVGVLRMSPGDELTVVDSQGAERSATIVEVTEERVVASLGPVVEREAESGLRLTLYHGLPRLPRYETALRMCTELGVATFVPVLTRRSVVRIDAADRARKGDRFRRIVESAAQQSGRVKVPEVLDPMSMDEALAHVQASGTRGVMPAAGLAGSDALSLGEFAATEADGAGELAVFIGPESGFDLSEQAEADKAGVTLVTMGPRILRTETAAVVAATICLEYSGALRADAAGQA